METLLRQLQHITPGPHDLTPLMIFDGNHIIENSFFESDDETVVLQNLPGDSLLRPRPPPTVTQQHPLPPATPLMDPLQLYYWYWSTGRDEDDEDDDDQWYALYPQVYSRYSHFQFPRRPI